MPATAKSYARYAIRRLGKHDSVQEDPTNWPFVCYTDQRLQPFQRTLQTVLATRHEPQLLRTFKVPFNAHGDDAVGAVYEIEGHGTYSILNVTEFGR